MRIAVFHNLPSGGAKRAVYDQVTRLAREHDVTVYTLGTADREFCDESSAVKVLSTPFRPLPLFRSPFGRLNQVMRSADIVRLRAVQRELARRIDREGYDVVLVHPCQFTVSPILLQFLETPTVYYCQDVNRGLHDPGILRPYPRRSSLQRRLDRIDPLPAIYHLMQDRQDRRGRAASDVYLTNSYFTRESAYRLYGRAPFVCYLGVDAALFRPLGLERKRQVVSVGAVSSRKGFDFVIRGLGTISTREKRPALVIVGNAALPEERTYLESLATEHGVEARFHTLITDEELVRLYNESMLTVYTPVMESFGLVPLESMACGTPVVGIAEGGVRETVVHGVNGLLVDRDTQQFAETVQSLLDDPARAQRLGQQGRQMVVENWNWDQAISNLVYHLEKAASREAVDE